MIIYARVSSYRQKDRGDLDRQVDYLRAYARERGWIVVDIIRDIASGLKTDRRVSESFSALSSTGSVISC